MRALALAFVSLSLVWSCELSAQDMIVNDGMNLTSLSRNQARLYFSQKAQLWPDGAPVRVFVLPDEHPLHRSFCKRVLGLFPYQLRRVWDRMVFSGTGQAPTTVTSEKQLIRGVATTPGAIGYAAEGSRHPGIRSLEVD